MPRFRHFSWYIKAFLKKHGKILIASTVIGILAFVLLPNLLSGIAFGKKTSYIVRVGRFPLSQLPRDIQEKVSYGLIYSDENGEVVPALASSYRIEENGKAYRFTIRPNVQWQDHKAVVPQDITYSFSDTEVARSQNDILFRLVAKKQDETAQEPVLPVSFLSTVSQPLFRQIPTRSFFFFSSYKVIGLGKYEITSIRNQGTAISQLTLESENERIIYRFYPTEDEAITAFKRGSVDSLEEMTDVSEIQNWNTVAVQERQRTDQYLGLFFNLGYRDGENAVFANKNLRVALNLAIEKQTGENRVLSPISKKSWAYVTEEADLDSFQQNMQEAAAQLVKAETPTQLKIDLTTTPTYIKRAEQIAQNWKDMGVAAAEACAKDKNNPAEQCANKKIEVTVRITNFPDLNNYQVLLTGQQIPRDPDQYTLWHSTQASNFTHLKNARIDKLLEDGRRTINREERKLIYQEFQTLLVKESPVVFLEPLTSYTVIRKNHFF